MKIFTYDFNTKITGPNPATHPKDEPMKIEVHDKYGELVCMIETDWCEWDSILALVGGLGIKPAPKRERTIDDLLTGEQEGDDDH